MVRAAKVQGVLSASFSTHMISRCRRDGETGHVVNAAAESSPLAVFLFDADQSRSMSVNRALTLDEEWQLGYQVDFSNQPLTSACPPAPCPPFPLSVSLTVQSALWFVAPLPDASREAVSRVGQANRKLDRFPLSMQAPPKLEPNSQPLLLVRRCGHHKSASAYEIVGIHSCRTSTMLSLSICNPASNV
ncbi:hypothetical protein EJ06DRAFT_154209 [Trichodelitschia bisporula]|uniref:Uncharacterized protein n=1 Tax=Trichodelitschia bisporula TaxID=703511 RepID=A0A6G1HNP7_9PEZI|nr:hypothetical protein EJ06DRAFT_154209 [Trichodelitschia bisporula]